MSPASAISAMKHAWRSAGTFKPRNRPIPASRTLWMSLNTSSKDGALILSTMTIFCPRIAPDPAQMTRQPDDLNCL